MAALGGEKAMTLWVNFEIETKRIKGFGSQIRQIKLNGFRKDKQNHDTSKEIYSEIIKLPCALTGARAGIECDHKNGRYPDVDLKLEDFQPLCRPANENKRQHCKKCKETNKRFDAKTLYHIFSWTFGDENYTEEIGCKGCFWYDIKDFLETEKRIIDGRR